MRNTPSRASLEPAPVSETAQERRNNADKAFKSLLEVKPEIALSAGIGAGFEFKVGLSRRGKFCMALKGHLVLGPGGGGGVAAELDVPQIVELVEFVRWSLEQSEFRFLEWIDSDAFSLISLILRVQTVSGHALVELVTWPIDSLQDRWREAESHYRAAIDAANQIVTNNDVINYTPQAKAGVLHLFSSNVSQAPRQNAEDSRRLASAAFAVLNTVKTHREFMEILRRMGQEDGTKGSVAYLKSNYVSLVLRFLYRSPMAYETEQWLSGLYS